MTGPGDDTGEMTPDRIFDDEQAESLLGGRPTADPHDDVLAAFFRTAKATAAQAPDEATQTLHLAAIAEAASHIERSAPRSRSRNMVSTIFKRRSAKIAAGAIAVVFATGGLAAADVLPEPAQDAVASIASNVGIDLPDSHEDDAKVKDGMDHDGDGVADDNGKHRGQNKTGMDHDGDGIPDDNGKRSGDDDATSENENSKRANDRVHDAQESTPPGPERGDAVSDAASQNRQDDENSNRQGPNNDGDDDDDAEGDDDSPGRSGGKGGGPSDDGDSDGGPSDDRGGSGKGRSDDDN